MPDLVKVRPGQFITDKWANLLIDEIRRNRVRCTAPLRAIKTDAGTMLSVAIPDGRVLFRNASSETAPIGAIMAVTGAEDVSGEICLVIDKPSTTFRRLYVVNSDVAVTNGLYGYCHPPGSQNVKMLYDTGTPANGEGWGPKPSQWSLSKNYPTTTTVHGIFSVSATLLSGSLFEINTIIGKTNASHAKSASGTINIYQGTAGSESIITSMTLSAYNKFAALASGKWVVADWINGQWYLTAGEC